MKIAACQISAFRRLIRRHYRVHGRELPWRTTRDPYRILVSEIMLQQTQIRRVQSKYRSFLEAFPDFYALQRAPLARVLKVWSGLGYNRRALALKQAASAVVREYDGTLPDNEKALRELPGVGRYTAAALMVFVHERPAILIETNIRAAVLHTFFQGRHAVCDQEIAELLARTLPKRKLREWYYGLMDYGSVLKGRRLVRAAQSAHHRLQPPFKSSRRELRGKLIRILTARREAAEGDLAALVSRERNQVAAALADLAAEGLLEKRKGRWRISRAEAALRS